MSQVLRYAAARSDAALGPPSGGLPLLVPWLVAFVWLAWVPGAKAELNAKADLDAKAGASTSHQPSATALAPAFRLHPLFDGSALASSVGLGVTLELLLNTSELTPQPPGPTEDLVLIDRWRAESDTFQRSGLSTIGSAIVLGSVLTDIVLADLLDRGEPWYHYAVLYAESAAIALMLTDITKIAVRRPRPTAYAAARGGEMASSQTDTALSFFSGHASVTAAVSATAIYLAFTRTDSAVERWLVFTGGLLLTLGVSTARVLEGEHFPTDVIAGVSVGAAVGLVVPELHRRRDSSETGLLLHPWGGQGVAGLGLSREF